MKELLGYALAAVLLVLTAIAFHKGVKAKAYSADGTYAGAVKSIFRRGGAQPK